MIQLKVNGAEQSFDGDPEMPLLWYLRDVLGLTGSKFGCGVGLCGACTVHVILRGSHARYGRKRSHDGRRPREERIASGSEGLDANQRAAMWLLPGGTDHAGGGFIEQQKEADRSRD